MKVHDSIYVLHPNQKFLAFVIDTNLNSCYFHDKISSFITGIAVKNVEDTNTYLEAREKTIKKLKFDDYFDDITDFIKFKYTKVSNVVGSNFNSVYPTYGWTNKGSGPDCKITKEKPYKYPSYNSVAIFVDESLDAKTIKFMKKMAREFPEVYSKFFKLDTPLKIRGFRLVEVITKIKTQKKL